MKKRIYTMLLVASVVSLAACQDSSSNKNKNQNDAGTLSVESCAKLPKRDSLNGTWMLTEKNKEQDITMKTLIRFTHNDMYIVSRSIKGDMDCKVSGSANIAVDSRFFKVLNEIRAQNEVYSKDKVYNLRCNIQLPAKTFAYGFNGGCLVMKDNGNEITLFPFDEATNTPVTPK